MAIEDIVSNWKLIIAIIGLIGLLVILRNGKIFWKIVDCLSEKLARISWRKLVTLLFLFISIIFFIIRGIL